MKKIISTLLFISFLALVMYVPVVTLAAPDMPAGAATGGLRYTVSVAKFENRSGWRGQWDIGDGWGIIMTDILQQTGKFIVLGESDMRTEAMKEQDFAASGRTTQGAITPGIGNMTPAQILVKGAITHVQHNTSGGGGGVSIGGVTLGGASSNSQINVTMYMIHTSTGQILASKSVIGKANKSGGFIGYSGNGWGAGAGGFKSDNLGKATENAVQQGVQWMIEQLPKITWRGNVIMVKDGSIYINRGTREGVADGMEFVIGSAEALRDPSTGEVLDVSFTEVGRITINSVKEKIAIGSLTSGNPELVKQGMFVQPPSSL
jgi:curli biogenesis system outer membrane secretion channel CsgG